MNAAFIRRVGFIPMIAIAASVAMAAEYTPPPLPPAVKFPSDKVVKVTDLGAKTDGYTYVTDAVNKAIDQCAAAGGGIVEFPKGDYLTGPIRLKSNITLQVDEGATIYFADDRSMFPMVKTRYEGVDIMNFSPLIYAYQCENIRITGKGTLDGQGPTWWAWAVPPRPGRGGRGGAPAAGAEEGDAAAAAPAASAPAVAGGRAATGPAAIPPLSPGRQIMAKYINDREGKFPLEDRVFGEKVTAFRPCFIEPYECKNVVIEGVTITQSPFWTIHPLYSENITVNGVTVIGRGPNTDGCDPDSCKTVLIENCNFTTGDDCIAIKSGKDGDGIHRNRTCENITIRDCVMNGGHGAITMGSETSAGILHVFAENCQVKGPDSTIRLKSARGRGGGVTDAFFRNIKTDANKKVAITIDMFYGFNARNGPPKPMPLGETTPVFKDIHIEDFSSEASPQSIMIRGLAESEVQNLVLKNVSIKAQQGASLENIDGLKRENVTVIATTGDAWTLKNVKEVK